MAYRRYNRRRRYRPRRTANRGGGYLGTAARALRLARYVKSLVNSELKTFDTAINFAQSNTQTLTHLTGVAQGDDYTNRSGRKIRAKSLQIKGSLTMSAAATNTHFRMILFKDLQNQGTVPSAANILPDIDDLRPSDPIFLKRFRIMWDRTIMLNERVDGNAPVKAFKYFKNIDIPVTYSGTSGTDEGQNSLWLR